MPTTKLGPHHMAGGADTRRWLQEARPTVAKFVGDLGASVEAPPGVLCVGRLVDDGLLGGQGFDANRMAATTPPKDAAAQYAALLAPLMRANPRIDVWEFANEQVIETDAVMAWYGAACHEFARLVAGLGKRAGLGGWATGTPAMRLWAFYTLALQATRDFGAVLTRHEYGPLNGFLSLRYRADQAEFDKLHYYAMPVIISECGADAVPGSGPWRAFYGNDAGRYWAELLRPYTVEIERDAYCLGATVFTSGGAGGWSQHDVTGSGLVDKVIEYAATVRPEPGTGDDEMTDEQRAAITAVLALLDTARADLLALIAPAPPWWTTWPEGVINPVRKLKAPPALIQIYQANGQPFNPPKWRQNAMDVSERRGNLLRVYDVAEPGLDWYVRAEDVQPA